MIRSLIFHAQYWTGRWLITAGLFALPRGRYRDELLKAIYELRDRCVAEVTVHRMLKQQRQSQ